MLPAMRTGLLCALLGVTAPAWAEYVTVISFGGANKEAQETAFYKPFKSATGNRVVHGSYNGDLAKLKRMVEISHVSWDVVEVEAPELARGCEEGLFEKLDMAKVGDPADFVPGAVQPCGVGIFVWTTLLAYNPGKVAGSPQGWADFWDVKKFPGRPRSSPWQWSGAAASTISTSGRCRSGFGRSSWPRSSSVSPASRSSRRLSPRTSPTARPTARR